MTELAFQTQDGSWELLGDYPDRESAITAARQWARENQESGTKVFGMSADDQSGHYEDRLEIHEDGTETLI